VLNKRKSAISSEINKLKKEKEDKNFVNEIKK
jgi:hypothetical protein